MERDEPCMLGVQLVKTAKVVGGQCCGNLRDYINNAEIVVTSGAHSDYLTLPKSTDRPVNFCPCCGTRIRLSVS